jgi:hypothetical protein
MSHLFDSQQKQGVKYSGAYRSAAEGYTECRCEVFGFHSVPVKNLVESQLQRVVFVI